MDCSVVKLPPNLDLKSQNAATEWKFWKLAFEDYLVATGQDEASDKVKLSLLRNLMGADAARIVSTFPLSDAASKKFSAVIDAIERYANPRVNTVFERFVFNTRTQNEGESFEHFFTDCRRLLKRCNYTSDADESLENQLLRDRIVQGIKDKNLQEALLRMDNLTLETAVHYCRTSEQSKAQEEQLISTLRANVMQGSNNIPPIYASKIKIEPIDEFFVEDGVIDIPNTDQIKLEPKDEFLVQDCKEDIPNNDSNRELKSTIADDEEEDPITCGMEDCSAICDVLMAESVGQNERGKGRKKRKKYLKPCGHNPKKYQCYFCNYVSFKRNGLRSHLKVHTGEKPYNCYICDYKFSRKSNLNRHLLRHAGLKPFKCTVCDCAFSAKDSLKRHLGTVAHRRMLPIYTGDRSLSDICDDCSN